MGAQGHPGILAIVTGFAAERALDAEGCGGFSRGFEQAGAGRGLVGGVFEFVGGGEGGFGDVLAAGMGLEGGGARDDGFAGGVDGGDVCRGLLVGARGDDRGELGERDVVHLADLDGGVGGVEQVVHKLGGEFGLGVGLHVFPFVALGA